MGKKLYIGNLPFSATNDALQHIFAQAGTVESAKVITDRDTGRSKGFGFVEMASDEDANKAIESLNGQAMGGLNLTVSEARPQAPREGGGGGRGPRGGGGGSHPRHRVGRTGGHRAPHRGHRASGGDRQPTAGHRRRFDDAGADHAGAAYRLHRSAGRNGQVLRRDARFAPGREIRL